MLVEALAQRAHVFVFLELPSGKSKVIHNCVFSAIPKVWATFYAVAGSGPFPLLPSRSGGILEQVLGDNEVDLSLEEAAVAVAVAALERNEHGDGPRLLLSFSEGSRGRSN